MDRPLLRTRNVSDSRSSHGRGTRTIRTTGPNVGHGPNNGPFRKATVAARKFAKVLSTIPVGDIATAASVSKETAKNWKLGKRMPNGEAMLDLGTNLRIVNQYIHLRIDRLEDAETEQACAEIEAYLAALPPHHAAVVRAKLSEAAQ